MNPNDPAYDYGGPAMTPPVTNRISEIRGRLTPVRGGGYVTPVEDMAYLLERITKLEAIAEAAKIMDKFDTSYALRAALAALEDSPRD